MEPLAIRKVGRNYTFYSDGLVITKKDKIIQEINYNEMIKITYNPKFGFADWVHMFLIQSGGGTSPSLLYKAFIIYLRGKISPHDVIGIPMLSIAEVEKIKEIVFVPIEMV